MNRWDVINHLIDKHGYKSYLEIGVMEELQIRKNFDLIACDLKVGVDPLPYGNPTYLMTSDDFFASIDLMFDIIFIDGLHIEDQVTKDLHNSLRRLNPGGSIVVHDCLPRHEMAQRVPRETEDWNGDVWKAWVKFRIYPYNMFVVNIDDGCGVIRNGNTVQKPFKPDLPLTYDNLVLNVQKWLNLISWEEFIQQ